MPDSIRHPRRRAASSRRGRRVPGRGSYCGGLRFAPTPLRCSAWGRRRRTRCAPRRALRSNSCDESVYEARKRARPQAEHRSRHRNRPRRVPPAARQTWWACDRRAPTMSLQSRVRAGRGASLRGAWVCLISWPRACALRELTRRTCLNGAARFQDGCVVKPLCDAAARDLANPERVGLCWDDVAVQIAEQRLVMVAVGRAHGAPTLLLALAGAFITRDTRLSLTR